MAGIDFIANHPFLVGVVLVGGFVLWKFIAQPIMNEGRPLDPTKEEIKGFDLDLDLQGNN